jgi:hypothetical protein
MRTSSPFPISIVRFVFLLTVAMLVTSCALSHRAAPTLQINRPGNESTFPTGIYSVDVSIEAHFSGFQRDTWTGYEWNLVDNGVPIPGGAGPLGQTQFVFTLSRPSDGVHHISVRARATRALSDNSTETSDWVNSNEICFFVGDSVPADFCTTGQAAQPIVVVATLTPSPTATATPVTPIPVRRNPNQHGTGCAQYTSQTSCNLAGCSWNPQSSSCSVNP